MKLATDDSDRFSHRSRKSRKSLARRKRFKPYDPYNKNTNVSSRRDSPLTNDEFFRAISINADLAKDFLREMDTPVCTSTAIFLPVELDRVAPGRCLALSPFGHTSTLGFDCAQCLGSIKTGSYDPKSKLEKQITEEEELRSVALCFYNNAERAVRYKAFYLSLLSISLNAVRGSLVQPGLLYGYTVLRTVGTEEIFPIFKIDRNTSLLIMFVIFKSDTLHLGEACLRTLTENLSNYRMRIDCVKKTYVLAFVPLAPEPRSLSVQEDSICEAVSALDYSDELKQEIAWGTSLVSDIHLQLGKGSRLSLQLFQ